MPMLGSAQSPVGATMAALYGGAVDLSAPLRLVQAIRPARSRATAQARLREQQPNSREAEPGSKDGIRYRRPRNDEKARGSPTLA